MHELVLAVPLLISSFTVVRPLSLCVAMRLARRCTILFASFSEMSNGGL
jgi:hypothetical protein